jgi:hypothetical protein
MRMAIGSSWSSFIGCAMLDDAGDDGPPLREVLVPAVV